MTDQIISVDYIRQKARNAYMRGVPRHGHNMNHGAAALDTWLNEWDRMANTMPVNHAAQESRP